MLAKILKQDRMLAPRIILALTTGMMLTCSAKVSFGQTAAVPGATLIVQNAATTTRAISAANDAPDDSTVLPNHTGTASAIVR